MKAEGKYSFDTGKIQTFGVADYTITAAMLVCSAAIGAFYVIKDRHNNSIKEYLLGGRSMHYIPVSMSLLVTYLSALSLLGAPAEVYRSNTMLFWFGVSVAVGCWIVSRAFLPFFYQLGISNVFQVCFTDLPWISSVWNWICILKSNLYTRNTLVKRWR